MPRDGSGVYSAPAGTTAVPNTPIESAKYNALVSDLVQDANTARPVTAGGTGQTSSSLPDTWTVHDPSDDTKKVRLDAGNVTAGQTRVLKSPDRDGTLIVDGVFAQCRLVKDGTNIRLNPQNGNWLTTGAGVALKVPSGGVALAPTGLSSSTTYYIYAHDSSGDGEVDLLLADTIVPVAQSNGVVTMTGYPERPLVGMARTTSGTAWADDGKTRWVISYFNRVLKPLENSFSANRTTTSTTSVEINSEIRLQFLTWGDTALTFQAWGVSAINSDNEAVYTALEIDSVSSSTRFGASGTGSRNGFPGVIGLSGNTQPAIGEHYVTLSGYASAGTAQWWGSDARLRVFLVGKIWG